MARRLGKAVGSDIETGVPDLGDVLNRNTELEILVGNLNKSLDASRHRERRLTRALAELGGGIALDLKSTTGKNDLFRSLFDKSTFLKSFVNRSTWLVGLMVLQSGSSYILSANETMLRRHPSIIYFLTMLIGAGGNAGNQATVRVIREIAMGTLDTRAKAPFVLSELLMACALGGVVAVFGFLRVLLLSHLSLAESVAVSMSLLLIVFVAVVVGALLPLLFEAAGLDPADSSTTIQVVMDIAGVLITCLVAAALLDGPLGARLLGTSGGDAATATS